jgi:hypothetical protein
VTKCSINNPPPPTTEPQCQGILIIIIIIIIIMTERNINHLLYMDDLKLIGRKEDELTK